MHTFHFQEPGLNLSSFRHKKVSTWSYIKTYAYYPFVHTTKGDSPRPFAKGRKQDCEITSRKGTSKNLQWTPRGIVLTENLAMPAVTCCRAQRTAIRSALPTPSLAILLSRQGSSILSSGAFPPFPTLRSNPPVLCLRFPSASQAVNSPTSKASEAEYIYGTVPSIQCWHVAGAQLVLLRLVDVEVHCNRVVSSSCSIKSL